MCCMCFMRFSVGELNIAPSGKTEDVCSKCALAEKSLDISQRPDDTNLMEVILRNRVKCLRCGDIIESFHRHDFKQCSCKTVAVDGGKDYLKRCFTNECDFEEMP